MAHAGGGAGLQCLEEELTCSVCYGVFIRPVSISCGHNFCRACITHYWDTLTGSEHRCPECRTLCSRTRITPALRLQNIISKVQAVIKEQAQKEVAGRAIQLVGTDDICLELNQDTVQSCFMDSGISDYPVSLLSVIGERRSGKSFLMNYILRALNSQEKGQPLNLGLDDEILQGFQWESGTDTTTKGIWIWSRPFILEREGKKVAVFVLDMESLIDTDEEQSSLQLSALSIILSSYLIFNVNFSLTSADLHFLEKCLQVSALMGESVIKQELKHLDILVRDWPNSGNCGREAAHSFIKHNMKAPHVLSAVKRSSVSCSLLPHPGHGILQSSQGRLADMNEDFRSYLTIYVSELVRRIGCHTKTDVHGETLTCAQLGRTLQKYGGLLLKDDQYFSTPFEMFCAIENSLELENIIVRFKEFLETQVFARSSPMQLFEVLPTTVKSKIQEASRCLLYNYARNLKCCHAQAKQGLLAQLQFILCEEEEKFLSSYNKRFKKCAIKCAVGAGVLGFLGGLSGVAMAGTALVCGVVGGTVALVATVRKSNNEKPKHKDE